MTDLDRIPLDSAMASARWIGWCGRVVGPVAAILVYWSLSGLSLESPPSEFVPQRAQAAGAVAVLLAVWWMTEAVPLPVTSLLPLILFPLTGVLTIDQAAAPYANKFIFLFLGGFMLARAVEKWQLHRRIALLTVWWVGTRPTRLVAGFMVATGGLSMWISNTASSVLMLPIGLSLVVLVREHLTARGSGDHPSGVNFATSMMLGIAYAASIGGVATLVGTPTNLFLAGFAAEKQITLGFGQWMLYAAPLSLTLLWLTWLLLTHVTFPIRIREIPGGRALIRDELARLGSMSRGEWTVLVVFAVTACSWVFRQTLTDWEWLVTRVPVVARVDDTIIALVAACSLFVIPVDARRDEFALDWQTAVQIPWGVLLLFGGGFCLAEAVDGSGLAQWIGEGVKGLPLSPWMLMAVVVTLVVFLTELTSNTPTAATFLPILYGVAEGLGQPAMLLLVPATVAASCAFMLPVATPPNAIVFGSGHVSIRAMASAGWWLNVVSVVVIVLWTWLVGEPIFGHAAGDL